jgi:hypothetical protein
MNNAFREPGSVDQTEVECTRIREAETTKRARIEAVEQTRQARFKSRENSWALPHFFYALAIATLGICSAIMYHLYIEAKYPNTTCYETEEIIRAADLNSARSCPAGGWYESKPVEGVAGSVLIHCHCGPRPAGSQ